MDLKSLRKLVSDTMNDLDGVIPSGMAGLRPAFDRDRWALKASKTLAIVGTTLDEMLAAESSQGGSPAIDSEEPSGSDLGRRHVQSIGMTVTIRPIPT